MKSIADENARVGDQVYFFPSFIHYPNVDNSIYKHKKKERFPLFCDTGSKFLFASTCRQLHDLFPGPYKTGPATLAHSTRLLQWALDNGFNINSVMVSRWAAALGKLDVLEWACNHGGSWDKIACDCAAASGHLDVLKWMHMRQFNWDERTCAAAAWNGYLEVLKWLHEKECPWDATTCAAAAIMGHLAVLRYARENGCNWDEGVIAEAAGTGNLEVVRWARENGCNWDHETCARAAMGGHLEVLQWAREEGCNWDETTCTTAARSGHFEVLQWARENGCPWHDMIIPLVAARGGYLQILKWALANGCDFDDAMPEAAARAASNGHLEVLKWFKDNDWFGTVGILDVDERVCDKAASAGHLEILKWAGANGCGWDERTCTAAVEAGHLEVLKWLRQNGCPWDDCVCSAAAACGGHFEILQWLRENGCDWDERVTAQAAERGHLELLKWAIAKGCKWEGVDCPALMSRAWSSSSLAEAANKSTSSEAVSICAAAARGGQLDVLKWAYANGLFKDAKEVAVCAMYAVEQWTISGYDFHFCVVKWAIEDIGCFMLYCVEAENLWNCIFAKCIFTNDVDTLKWFMRQRPPKWYLSRQQGFLQDMPNRYWKRGMDVLQLLVFYCNDASLWK